nr:putative nuclease HARBI1 [Tanacetum cinerariifolium]
TKNKANNVRNSPLLYPDLCTYLYEKCVASSPNRQVYGKQNRTPPSSSHNPVNQVLQIEDVPIDEGGSSIPPPTNENHDANFDTRYDNDFEGGYQVPPPKSPSRARPKKKAKGGVFEFEEDMKRAMINLAKCGFFKNKGPSADECHEKLKIIGLESNDLLYLATFLIFSKPGGNYRDTWMTLPPDPNVLKGYIQMVAKQLKGAVGALDRTLVHAFVPFTQHLYRARGLGDCYQNVLAICDFNMIFTYVVVVWEGTTHDARILNEALIDPEADFPMPPSDKYYLCDVVAPYQNVRYWLGDFRQNRAMNSREKFNHAHAKLRNVMERAFGVLKARFPIMKKMPSYPLITQRDITVACFAIHNFIRSERLSDEFFPLYDHREVDGSSNSQDDNVVDEDVQPYRSAADQEYMTSLRDSIATQCP